MSAGGRTHVSLSVLRFRFSFDVAYILFTTTTDSLSAAGLRLRFFSSPGFFQTCLRIRISSQRQLREDGAVLLVMPWKRLQKPFCSDTGSLSHVGPQRRSRRSARSAHVGFMFDICLVVFQVCGGSEAEQVLHDACQVRERRSDETIIICCFKSSQCFDRQHKLHSYPSSSAAAHTLKSFRSI